MARRRTAGQNEFDAELGRRIERLRKAQKITATQLAQRLGVTPQSLYNYEAGLRAITASTLLLLAEALRVEVAELLSDSQQTVESPTPLRHSV